MQCRDKTVRTYQRARRAQADGYRARAAYKLLEIDARDQLLKPGSVVVDLGAAPGSWCQVAVQRCGRDGKVFALDLLPMEPVAGVDFLQGDFSEETVLAGLESRLGGAGVDLVLSDMAPNISGIATVDQAMPNARDLGPESDVSHQVEPSRVRLEETQHLLVRRVVWIIGGHWKVAEPRQSLRRDGMGRPVNARVPFALVEDPVATDPVRLLEDHDVPETTLLVVALTRASGDFALHPAPETVLRAGDRLRVFGLPAQIEDFRRTAREGA